MINGGARRPRARFAHPLFLSACACEDNLIWGDVERIASSAADESYIWTPRARLSSNPNYARPDYDMCKSLLSMVALNIKCDKLWRRTLVRRLAQLVAKTFSQGVIYEGCLAASFPPPTKTLPPRVECDSYFHFYNRQHLEHIPTLSFIDSSRILGAPLRLGLGPKIMALFSIFWICLTKRVGDSIHFPRESHPRGR